MEKRISQNFKTKEKTVAEIEKKLGKAKSVVFVETKKVTVAEDTELRNKFRAAGVDYKVYKNRLVKIALNNFGINELDSNLKGQLTVAFSNNDETSGAKIISAFEAKEKIVPQFGLLGRNILNKEDVIELANLPTMDVLIAKLLGLINSGAQGIAGVVNAPTSALARVISAGVK